MAPATNQDNASILCRHGSDRSGCACIFRLASSRHSLCYPFAQPLNLMADIDTITPMALPQAAARLASVRAPVMGLVADLIRQNPGTISLGQGVAHYGPPEAVVQHVQDYIRTPSAHGYGYGTGHQGLRDALAQKVRAENRLSGGFEVVVTAGSNMAFFEAILAITDPGDEVILLAPYYFNHEMAVGIADCQPVVVPSSPDLVPDLTVIKAYLSSRTRAIVTVSPNNPTGVVYSPSLLKAINRLCAENGIYHLSDEAYEYFTFEGARHYSPGATPGASKHTISLYSMSKSYGMAGWRLGYMALPAHLLPAVKKVQDTNVICASLPSQHAAMAALEVGPAYCRQYLPGLDKVRKMVLERLATLGSRISVARAEGAFFLFLDLNTTMPSDEVCKRLIQEYGVATIPGGTFGHHVPSMRIAYGNLKQDMVAEGMERLCAGLRALL